MVNLTLLTTEEVAEAILEAHSALVLGCALPLSTEPAFRLACKNCPSVQREMSESQGIKLSSNKH